MSENKFLIRDEEIQSENHESFVNKKNNQEFRNLMERSKKRYDHYWDINNLFIRVILFILFIIIVLGASYYFIMWFL